MSAWTRWGRVRSRAASTCAVADLELPAPRGAVVDRLLSLLLVIGDVSEVIPEIVFGIPGLVQALFAAGDPSLGGGDGVPKGVRSSRRTLPHADVAFGAAGRSASTPGHGDSFAERGVRRSGAELVVRR